MELLKYVHCFLIENKVIKTDQGIIPNFYQIFKGQKLIPAASIQNVFSGNFDIDFLINQINNYKN